LAGIEEFEILELRGGVLRESCGKIKFSKCSKCSKLFLSLPKFSKLLLETLLEILPFWKLNPFVISNKDPC
jgi:hypothetical protein